jgi:hypothetical protein
MAPLIIQRIVCPGCASPLCEWCGKADIYPDYHCVVHSNLVVNAARCPNENCHGLVYRCSEIVEVDGFPYLGDLENFISCELCKYRPVSENIEYIVDIVDIADIANNNGNNVDDDDMRRRFFDFNSNLMMIPMTVKIIMSPIITMLLSVIFLLFLFAFVVKKTALAC